MVVDVYAERDPYPIAPESSALFSFVRNTENAIAPWIGIDPRLLPELGKLEALKWLLLRSQIVVAGSPAAPSQIDPGIVAAIQQVELAAETEIIRARGMQERKEQRKTIKEAYQSSSGLYDPYGDGDGDDGDADAEQTTPVDTAKPATMPRFSFIGRLFGRTGVEIAIALNDASSVFPSPRTQDFADAASNITTTTASIAPASPTAFDYILEASTTLTARRLSEITTSPSLITAFNAANGPTVRYRPGLPQDNFAGAMDPAKLIA